MMSNICKPTQEGIFRIIFLYVGQGESTLLFIPDGSDYKSMLIDSNTSDDKAAINIAELLERVLDEKKLDYFINTHPHTDHTSGLKDISDSIEIGEVWHADHVPSKKHEDAYKELTSIMKKVGTKRILNATQKINHIGNKDYKLGDVDYQILSPAEYVKDDIGECDPDERYNRIHEQCGVIKFMYGNPVCTVLITGDSDKSAWKKHITNYHKSNLKANILSASHHGSRTFFKDNENDDPFTDHLKAIEPEYLIISAPPQKESKHKHPHDDAIDLYKKEIEHILHLGDIKGNKYSIIIDITKEGGYTCEFDNDGMKTAQTLSSAGVITQLDDKPMGYK